MCKTYSRPFTPFGEGPWPYMPKLRKWHVCLAQAWRGCGADCKPFPGFGVARAWCGHALFPLGSSKVRRGSHPNSQKTRARRGSAECLASCLLRRGWGKAPSVDLICPTAPRGRAAAGRAPPARRGGRHPVKGWRSWHTSPGAEAAECNVEREYTKGGGVQREFKEWEGDPVITPASPTSAHSNDTLDTPELPTRSTVLR
eukprot:gene11950-biopygen3391